MDLKKEIILSMQKKKAYIYIKNDSIKSLMNNKFT